MTSTTVTTGEEHLYPQYTEKHLQQVQIIDTAVHRNRQDSIKSGASTQIFSDFKKAFDSAVTELTVNLSGKFYNHFELCTILDNNLT